MNAKLLAAVALLAVAGLYFVRAADEAKPAPDPRIDKLIQQNEQILKNQDEIKQKLDKMTQDLLQLRRRAS